MTGPAGGAQAVRRPGGKQKRPMKQARQLIINCGASQLTAAEFSGAGDGLCLKRVEVEPLELEAGDDAGWPDAAGAALARLAARGLGGEARFLLPGGQVLTKTIRVPQVEKARQAQVIAFEAQQNIPYPLGEILWDSQVVESDGVEMEVLFIAARKEVLHRFFARAREAGFRPVSAGAATIMDYNALRHACPGLEGETLLINIGARTTTLLFTAGAGFFVRTINLGGDTLARMAAEQPGGPPSAADGFMRRLSQEITRSMVNYRRQRSGGDPQRIFLTGGGALLPGLPGFLAEARGVEVEFFDPLRRMAVDPAVELADGLRLRLGEVVGEAVARGLPGAAGVNLLPAEVRTETTFARRRPYLLAAAACLALAPLAPWWSARSAAAATEARVEAARARVADLQSMSGRIAAEAETARALRQSLGRIEGLVAGKSNWIRFLAGLQASLAEAGDVWLDEMEVVRGSDPDGGPLYEVALSGQMLLRGDAAAAPGTVDQEALARRISGLCESFADSEFVLSAKPPVITWTSLQQGLKVLPFRINLVVNPARPI